MWRPRPNDGVEKEEIYESFEGVIDKLYVKKIK